MKRNSRSTLFSVRMQFDKIFHDYEILQEGLTKMMEYFTIINFFVKLHPHREESVQGISFHSPIRFPYRNFFSLGDKGIDDGKKIPSPIGFPYPIRQWKC